MNLGQKNNMAEKVKEKKKTTTENSKKKTKTKQIKNTYTKKEKKKINSYSLLKKPTLSIGQQPYTPLSPTEKTI